jgi:hypothetical protein
MPRGRPRLPLSDTERLEARRAQVRANVQALRRRRHGLTETPSTAPPVNGEISFIFYGDKAKNDGKLKPRKSYSEDSNKALMGSAGPSVATTVGIRPSNINRTSLLLPSQVFATNLSREQFVGHFLSVFKPAISKESEYDRSIAVHWIQILPDLVNRNQVLDLSLQAFCAMQLGRANGDRNLCNASLNFYGMALRALRRILSRPQHMFSEYIFTAATVLGTHEVCNTAQIHNLNTLKLSFSLIMFCFNCLFRE